LLGRPLDLETLEALQRKANKTGKPMRTAVADPAYRRSMIGALIAKAAVRLAPALGEALEARQRPA
jgi:CO/xanthine dehydrogenase FAD-binding subunit